MFKEKLNNVVQDALNALAEYEGEKLITLSSNEKAFDIDDAYLIVSLFQTPKIRDKRSQRIFEKTNDETIFEDDEYLSNRDAEYICELADKLLA